MRYAILLFSWIRRRRLHKRPTRGERLFHNDKKRPDQLQTRQSRNERKKRSVMDFSMDFQNRRGTKVINQTFDTFSLYYKNTVVLRLKSFLALRGSK